MRHPEAHAIDVPPEFGKRVLVTLQIHFEERTDCTGSPRGGIHQKVEAVVFVEQVGQGCTIEHIDLHAFDPVNFTFAPAAGDHFGTAVAQHFGCRQPDPRSTTQYDCFLILEIAHFVTSAKRSCPVAGDHRQLRPQAAQTCYKILAGPRRLARE